MTTKLSPINELKAAYRDWLKLPEGMTDEEAGPVYTRWCDAYQAAYNALPVWQLQVILRECRVDLGLHL